MKKIIYQLIMYNLIFVSVNYGQIIYSMEAVVVTASRIQPEYKDLLRTVSVIDKDIIKNIPANSIMDILNYQIGVDIQNRGYQGVQGDISMRGSSFEQVLVMVDGVKINDSQTAHHNMDLPVNLSGIERVEVMRGHGSSMYGPGAFGGVINIITKNTEKTPFKISTSAGDFGLLQYEISKSFGLKKFKNFVTINNKKSSGYRFDSDFDKFTVFSKSQIDLKNNPLFLSLGYLDNDYGANNFYGPSPSKEHTKTFLTSLSSEIERFENVVIEPKIFLKKHKDTFIYDVREPDKYVNNHIKYRIGGELIAKIALPSRQKLIIGTEIINDNITSTKLGTHNITNSAIFTEYGNTFKDNILVNFGIRGDFQSNYSGLYPTVSFGYKFSKKLKVRSSIGKCFRIPSFTELYYQDPSNNGNPELKPEKGWSYEAGIDYFSGNRVSLQSNLFLRNQFDVIDWISMDSGNHWYARNVGKINIKGIENILGVSQINDFAFSLKYAYTHSDFEREFNYLSKYVFTHPVHQFVFETNYTLPFQVRSSTAISLKKRRDRKSYVVMNMNISKKFKNTLFFVGIMNLFNERYQEIFGVPAPGRWFESGIKFEL